MMDIEQARNNMISQQLRTNQVLDDRLLSVVRATPREDFVPAGYQALAYADTQIPLGCGQSMMSPMSEALVLQALALQPTDTVLLLGSDSGYFSYLVAQLAHQLICYDPHKALEQQQRQKLEASSVQNVSFLSDDLTKIWQKGPFDVIILTGSLPKIDPEFVAHLVLGGRLFVVEGQSPAMKATIVTKQAGESLGRRVLFETDRPRWSGYMEKAKFVF